MRFHVVRDPQARPAAYRKLIRAAVGDHTVTSGVLAMVACGLVITACGSQNAPGAASSEIAQIPQGRRVRRQPPRRLCHNSVENRPHQHRRTGGPSWWLPQVHQRQRYPMSHERLACCGRADGLGTGHAPAAHAIEHVRRLALQCPATCSNAPTRRFRLRDRGSRR